MRKLCLMFLLLQSVFANKALILEPEEREIRNIDFEKVSKLILESSSGADIIGNGGGVLEQNMIYLYRNLDRFISHCMMHPLCASTDEKQFIIKEIRNLIVHNRDQKNRLVFLKKNHFNSFFQNDLDPSERIAKTGFSSAFPIYINLPLAEKMAMEKDLSLLLGILIHEVGHQVGVASHSFLDELAAEIRIVFYDNFQNLDVNVADTKVSFFLFNGSGEYDYFQAKLLVGDTFHVLENISDDLDCPTGYRLTGSKLNNQHWEKPSLVGTKWKTSLKAWVDYYCHHKRDDYITTFTAEVEYKLRFKIDSENQSRLDKQKAKVRY